MREGWATWKYNLLELLQQIKARNIRVSDWNSRVVACLLGVATEISAKAEKCFSHMRSGKDFARKVQEKYRQRASYLKVQVSSVFK